MNKQELKVINNCEKIDEAPVLFEWKENLGTYNWFNSFFDPRDLDVRGFGYDRDDFFGNHSEPNYMDHYLLVKGKDAHQVKNYFWSKGIEFTFRTITETTYLYGDQDLGAVAHKIGNQWYWEQDND
ncbi:hypothetical protein [Crocosphaera sp.]|uniref:hypothetical protein n=1 Tax=Crocosphaera sp. TaxID=2729996 RepID=UPI002609A392|nr:hypothetical protein [Crocosphaera sp.]MDJ0579060.1 hypothetical protein [Crocosphaera sp.]